MDYSHRLEISYYKTIAVINESHKIYLVQHTETKQVCVKKILDVYNLDIYESLYKNPVPGTPKIIAYYEENEQLTVIEEYISGTSLAEKLPTLTEQDMTIYLSDLCNVLELLHQHKPSIIHRDIKPSNVIITNLNRAVLLDFNAAKYYSETAEKDTLLLGTQGYAAPEQYGFGTSSPQTDIYSIGILLKEMLATLGDTQKDYSRIAERCTQLDPAYRYQSIAELRQAFITAPSKVSANGQENEQLGATNVDNQQGTGKQGIHLELPGFRTKTPWKMLVSILYYLFDIWLSFTLTVENTYGGALWVTRIYIFLFILTLPFATCNYRNIQELLPLCKSKKRPIRYLGILLLNVLLLVLLSIIFILIMGFCFPTPPA